MAKTADSIRQAHRERHADHPEIFDAVEAACYTPGGTFRASDTAEDVAKRARQAHPELCGRYIDLHAEATKMLSELRAIDQLMEAEEEAGISVEWTGEGPTGCKLHQT